MLTPEGIAQNLKTSICGFEVDPYDLEYQVEALVTCDKVLDHIFGCISWFATPPDLETWKDHIRILTARYDVRVHIINTAGLPDFERGKKKPGYIKWQMNELRKLANELKAAIHIVAPTPKVARQGNGRIKPIHASGDFIELSDYGICVASLPYLAKLKRGGVRKAEDADIAEANACRPYVDADSHIILAIDKVKSPRTGRPGVYAFAYDVARSDLIFDAGATMLVRKIWSV
jgi:hypothetical protein